MASLGGEQIISEVVADSVTPRDVENTNFDKKNVKTPIKDREDKLKIARERQNEERQKKIEELKLQAEAAQKYREQKEEERKRRIEELRSRDNEKRHQVEERKRAIIEAEKERREYILRKNQERDARLETKKRNDKSLIGFAFGSSTPRLLEPADFGTVSPSIYWGHRRSTSITNVAYTGASIPRRSCERELTDGCKKRATSAGGVERHDEEIVDAPQIAYRSVARRKTDLMPTLPSPRDSYFGSKTSLSNTPKTTGRAVSMDRLDQLSQPLRRNGEHIRAIIEREKRQHIDINDMMLERCDNSNNFGKSKKNLISISGSMNHIASGNKPINNMHKAEKSLAFFGSNLSTSNIHTMSMSQLSGRYSTVGINKTSRNYNKDDNTTSGSRSPGGSNFTSRPGSAMSSSTLMSMSGSVHRRSAPVTRKPRPVSIAGTAVSSIDIDEANKQRKVSKMSVPKVPIRAKKSNLSTSMTDSMINSISRAAMSTEKKTPEKKELYKPPAANKTLPRKLKEWTPNEINEDQNSKTKEEKDALNSVKIESTDKENVKDNSIQTNNALKSTSEKTDFVVSESSQEKTDNETEKDVKKIELLPERQDLGDMMTASMIARSKITTEEEAKAALAERRRIAREEAEKQAELERQRLEAERLAEIQKQTEEEEQQRKFEEEANRLAIEQRRAEQERLNQAIEEAQKREEAEKLKREEEENLRIEREEAEKKAKEEAEKQREEQADRLRREEKEREERRKRVEAIMSRTRKASTPYSTPVKDSENSKVESKTNEEVPTTETETEDAGTVKIKNETAPISDVVKNDSLIQNKDKLSDHQALYEKSVADKESDLMNYSIFSNVILDMIDIDASTKNSKNIQQKKNEVAIGNVENEQDIVKNGALVNVSSTDQLIDLNNVTENLNNPVHFNNNNSLLGSTGTLVTADNHEKTEITL